jgi:hypothetical protein
MAWPADKGVGFVRFWAIAIADGFEFAALLQSGCKAPAGEIFDAGDAFAAELAAMISKAAVLAKGFLAQVSGTEEVACGGAGPASVSARGGGDNSDGTFCRIGGAGLDARCAAALNGMAGFPQDVCAGIAVATGLVISSSPPAESARRIAAVGNFS